jgi:predicted alpha/beta-fold hydrolase
MSLKKITFFTLKSFGFSLGASLISTYLVKKVLEDKNKKKKTNKRYN